jgi:hypothetical protein
LMTNRFKDQLIVLNYYCSERSGRAIRTGATPAKPRRAQLTGPG